MVRGVPVVKVTECPVERAGSLQHEDPREGELLGATGPAGPGSSGAEAPAPPQQPRSAAQ